MTILTKIEKINFFKLVYKGIKLTMIFMKTCNYIYKIYKNNKTYLISKILREVFINFYNLIII